ncbi:MAG: hypothetical protein JST87_03210 [Bacteroidetes bacterium]|nr:hypothetical protein [Bacteroidota bacterium]
MKHFSFLIPAIGLLFFATSCHRGNSIIISNNDDNLYINYQGEIQFTDDETAIKSITPNGFLKYTRNNKKLVAENSEHGEIKYDLDYNGKKLNPNDADGKQFMADVIKDMIQIGFDARGRMERLYKKGGTEAVLNEVQNMKADYVKGLYLEYLLATDSLSQYEIKEIAKKIGSQIGSDYDKGRLLVKFPYNYLVDSLTTHAWFEAVKTIGSDYEKANALTYIARQPITPEQFNQTVDVANTIGSDYDKANILKELIFKRNFTEDNFDKTLDAVSYIGGDYEKANLLKALIEKEKPSGDHFNKLIDVTQHLGSDYDKANLIREMIETGLPAGASFDKLLSAVIHTGSEFDKANMLRDITTKNIATNEQWISIINATGEISSDADKSNFLVSIAPSIPKNDSVKTAFMRVARTINNESDLGRTIKAME